MIRDAKIVGIGQTSAAHHDQTAKRGDKEYCMSYSEIKAFARSPFSWRYGKRKESNAAMEWGSLVDSLAMPCAAGGLYIVAPETYGPDSKPWNWNAKECKAWREAQPSGVRIIKADVYAEAEQAAKALRECPATAPVFTASDYQVEWSAVWVDPDTSLVIPLAGVIDMVPTKDPFLDSLADLKTTTSLGEKAWAKQVFSMSLNIQAALYLDVYKLAMPKERRDVFLHIIQTDEPPYEVGWRELDDEFIKMGRNQYKAALKDYALCLATGDWPRLDEMESNNRSPRGWNVTNPEAWMVMQGPAQFSRIEDI